jgi:hypothetical protein
MALVLEDRVRESTTTTGIGAFTLGGAIAGYRSFSSVMANSDTTWYACVLPGGAWEVGVGTWVTGNTLQRTTILRSSNANSVVNFPAGTKDIFIGQPALKANVLNNTFPVGTLMLFQQTAAPIYWTKQVTHNDKALRVVSGAASSGGSNAFSTVMAQTVVGNTTITQSTMASHGHTNNAPANSSGGGITGGGAFQVNQTGAGATINSTGGDGAHNHTISLNIQYVDLIICSKD